MPCGLGGGAGAPGGEVQAPGGKYLKMLRNNCHVHTILDGNQDVSPTGKFLLIFLDAYL